MQLPILEKLKGGEKFDFETLADNVNQTEEYWNWWWTEKSGGGTEMRRPEVISDDDPILIKSIDNPTADFRNYTQFYDRFIIRLIQTGYLPSSSCTRTAFREQVHQVMRGCSVKLTGQPHLIFTGGGYGSGKTVKLQMLADSGMLQVEMRHLVGVDNFKHFIP
jgi:hypothetical protein